MLNSGKKNRALRDKKNIVTLVILNEPTKVTENSSSIIDLILCNKPENIVKSGSICVGLSDHNIIHCCRKIKRSTSGKHKNIKIRSLEKYNTASFVEELNKID
jgi:hypothetical protein